MEKSVDELIAELIKMGEDEEELTFWKNTLAGLSEEERRKVIANFEKEHAALKRI